MYMKITNPHDEANHVYNVDVEIYKLLKTIKFVHDIMHDIMRYIIVLNLMHIPEDCVTWPT